MQRLRTRIQTPRLLLRPFVADDAGALRALAGAREIADTTISIPHPYSDAAARAFIASQAQEAERGTALHLAVTLRETRELIGAVGLRDIERDHRQAELGFWIGVPWWGQGFATEAAQALVAHGFEKLGLNRIHAHHMVRNPASGVVLARIGMKSEGLLRERVQKWGAFEDVAIFAVLRRDRG